MIRRLWARLRRLWARPAPARVLQFTDFRRRCREMLPEGYAAVVRRDPCVYCGVEAAGRDHIQPRSQGGPDSWENRAPACRVCDSSKSSTSLLRFLMKCRRLKRTPAHWPRPSRSDHYFERKAWRREMSSRWKLGEVARYGQGGKGQGRPVGAVSGVRGLVAAPDERAARGPRD